MLLRYIPNESELIRVNLWSKITVDIIISIIFDTIFKIIINILSIEKAHWNFFIGLTFLSIDISSCIDTTKA